jgi:excisionase family DNA binding protein
MEKICIVRLRKKMANAVDLGEGYEPDNDAEEDRLLQGLSFPETRSCGIREVQDETGGGEVKNDGAGRTISLQLTEEQRRTLRANPGLVTMLDGQSAGGLEARRRQDESIVLKLEFNAIPPLRLLKVEEVTRMLGISKSYLLKTIQQGKLRSYKFGRLRRIMLEDLLSYLADHQESPDAPQPAEESRITLKEIV